MQIQFDDVIIFCHIIGISWSYSHGAKFISDVTPWKAIDFHHKCLSLLMLDC